MEFQSEFEKVRNFLILHRADYNYVHRHFEWPRLDKFNWALDYFDKMAKNNSGIALWQVNAEGGEKKYSFSEISARSNQVANFFKTHGIKKGQTIFLLVDDDPVLWEIMLGAMKIGAVMIPNSLHLSDEELKRRLSAQKVDVLICSNAICDKFSVNNEGVLCIGINSEKSGWVNYDEVYYESTEFNPTEETLITDPLFKYFTSGPHARDNIIEHTYGSFTIGHLSTMYWMGVRPGDVHLSINSTGWSQHAWSSFIAPWNAEATVFVFKEKRFDPQAVLRALEDYPITSFLAPPVVWRHLCELDLGAADVSLRELLSTGDILGPDIISTVYHGWEKFIRNGYSLTETPVLIGVPPQTEDSYGSLGVEMPGFKINLLDKEGQPADYGEICLDTEDGLWGVEKSLDLQGTIFHTGDFAYRDDRGNYNFGSREDGIFKSSGYKVSPYEIENILKENPYIREVVVIPSPHPHKEAVPKAYISLVKGQVPSKELARDILDFSKSKISAFKRIRRVEFSEIPRDTEGQVLRKELIRKEVEKIRTQLRSNYEFWEEDYKINIDENWAQDFP